MRPSVASYSVRSSLVRGTATNADPGLGADPVGDRGGEVVAVADATEVGEQDRLDRVVGPLEGGGEPEPLLILGQQALAQHGAAEPMALVGDQDAAALRCREGDTAGGRVAGRDQDIAVDGAVAIAVAEPADVGVGHPAPQALVPLLHQDPRRHDHEGEQPPAHGVLDRGQGDVGLARTGDGLDDTAASATVPGHQRVVLPPVEGMG